MKTSLLIKILEMIMLPLKRVLCIKTFNIEIQFWFVAEDRIRLLCHEHGRAWMGSIRLYDKTENENLLFFKFKTESEGSVSVLRLVVP